MKYHEPSTMFLKFVNGQQMKYHMGACKFGEIKDDVLRINYWIEYERSMAGNDDELDDEAVA